LWKTLIDRKVTKTELCEKAEISRSTLAKMVKDEKVALDVIERICNALECQIYDVMEIR
jgi:DNA-binding Xre family transcriptional regulator